MIGSMPLLALYNYTSTPIPRGAIMTKGQLACPCCGIMGVQTYLIISLDALERLLGLELLVTSGYRCKKHNSEIKPKATPNSMHCIGLAVDFVRPNVPLETLWDLAQKCGFHGIGVRDNSIHLDMRKTALSWKYGQGGKIIPYEISPA